MKLFKNVKLMLLVTLTMGLIYTACDDNSSNSNEGNISVTGVTLSQSTANMYPYQELQLNATIAPLDATNKNVTWSSDAESIASVDSNGKVRAADVSNNETVTITATTEDGGFTAQCVITVYPSH